MNTKPNYEEIAGEIMFLGRLDFEKHRVEYRKHKSRDDIVEALEKASKNGHFKTEFEISMFAIYLKSILKKKK